MEVQLDVNTSNIRQPIDHLAELCHPRIVKTFFCQERLVTGVLHDLSDD